MAVKPDPLVCGIYFKLRIVDELRSLPACIFLFHQQFWIVPINTCTFLIVDFAFSYLSDFVHVCFPREVLYSCFLKWLRARNYMLRYNLLSWSAAWNICREHQHNTSRCFSEACLNLQWSKDENAFWCFILLVLLPLLLRVTRSLYCKRLHLTEDRGPASNTLC